MLTPSRARSRAASRRAPRIPRARAPTATGDAGLRTAANLAQRRDARKRRFGRRGWFVGAKDLVTKIDALVTAYDDKAHPFVRTAASQAMLDRVARRCKAIRGTEDQPAAEDLFRGFEIVTGWRPEIFRSQ